MIAPPVENDNGVGDSNEDNIKIKEEPKVNVVDPIPIIPSNLHSIPVSQIGNSVSMTSSLKFFNNLEDFNPDDPRRFSKYISTDFNLVSGSNVNKSNKYKLSDVPPQFIGDPNKDPRFMRIDTPEEHKETEHDFEQSIGWDYHYDSTMTQFWEYMLNVTDFKSPAIEDAFQHGATGLWGGTQLAYFQSQMNKGNINKDFHNLPLTHYVDYQLLGQPEYFIRDNGEMEFMGAPNYRVHPTQSGSAGSQLLDGLVSIGNHAYQQSGYPGFTNMYAMMYAIQNPHWMDMVALSNPGKLKNFGITIKTEGDDDWKDDWMGDYNYQRYLTHGPKYEVVNNNGEVYLMRTKGAE